MSCERLDNKQRQVDLSCNRNTISESILPLGCCENTNEDDEMHQKSRQVVRDGRLYIIDSMHTNACSENTQHRLIAEVSCKYVESHING